MSIFIGLFLIVASANIKLGREHLIADFTTAPVNKTDATGRITELSPYALAILFVIILGVSAARFQFERPVYYIYGGLALVLGFQYSQAGKLYQGDKIK